MAPLLLYLTNNGLTNEDIINMSQLVVSLQNSTFLTNTSSQGGNTANGIGNNNTEKNSKWNLKITFNKLRSIQNIDSEIEKLRIHCNDLRLEIDYLNTKKDGIEELYIEIEDLCRSISWLNYTSLQWINAITLTRPTVKWNYKHESYPFFLLAFYCSERNTKKDDKMRVH